MRVKVFTGVDSFEAEVVQEINIHNHPYVIVDLGIGAHARGLFSRYFVVSTSCIEKQIENVRVD